MRATRIMAAVLIIGCSLVLWSSKQPGAERTDRATVPTTGGTQRETVTVVADEPIPNLPGKRLVAHVVDYRPGGGSAPHRHARSAFIYAYVVSGEIRSQVDGEPARVYRTGEAWFERPGSHHPVSVNASSVKPARLLAVVIVDDADKQLTIPDPQ